VLLKIEQIGGAACHTGKRSCFFRKLEDGKLCDVGVQVFDPREVYKK
jgi:phosphoribosyl-AMP cyclohydrolase